MRQALFVLLATTALLGPLALAQSPSLGPDRDTGWGQEERTLEWRLGYTEATLTSIRNTTLGDDRWELAFDAKAATLRLVANGTRPDGVTGTEMAIRVRSLIEFHDGDGDGRLGLGDPVIQQILLTEGNGWIEGVRRADGQVEPHAHYMLRGARLDILFHPTATGILAGGGSPTATAFEVRVDSFPYLTDNRTHLALELRIDSPVSVAGSAVVSPSGPLRSFLAWESPDSSNATHAVTLQRYLGEPNDEWLLMFSQPREQQGSLSLALGVARLEPADSLPQILRQITGDWRFYVVGLIVAAVAVGVPLYRKVRQTEGPR